MNYVKTSSRLIRNIFHPMLFCGLAGCITLPVLAQTVLTPEKERISDQAIQADHGAYRQLQEQIHQLNEAGRTVRDYDLSKAQCWLDVSFHEYTRNDRSAFAQDALTESEKLIIAMKNGQAPISRATPLVNGAARLRPDLWERAGAVKVHAGFQCAQQKVACAEVELVHAGHEFNQQQWRHAKPYVQIAEELVAEAETLAASCNPPASPALAVVPTPAAPVKTVLLLARVLFEFDRHDMQHADLSDLNRALEFARDQGLEVQALALIGHADRLNGTGGDAYNLQLSQKRAAAVREVLARRGIDVSKVRLDFKGDSQQVQACSNAYAQSAGIRQCLAANRRVEVQLTGVPKR